MKVVIRLTKLVNLALNGVNLSKYRLEIVIVRLPVKLHMMSLVVLVIVLLVIWLRLSGKLLCGFPPRGPVLLSGKIGAAKQV